jgi:16S rRNA (adenine1518-N6/adenine1519-N6)-dimethyltransferase
VNRTIPAPKKRLGQHFLHSPYYAQRIADAVETGTEGIVVEIGPGRGAVSIFLKERFPRFHLIETDFEIIPFLKEKLGEGEWTLHQADALEFDFQTLGTPLHIVGNLPYNVGALIIRKTLLYAPQVASVTYMVQREVAERIAAEPHTKQMGFLSIFCQFFGRPRILFKVPQGAFFPKPKVESAVFQLIVDKNIEDRITRDRWESFFNFVSRCFTMRRKTLATILSWENGNKSGYHRMLDTIGLDRKVRPEDLDMQKWAELYKRVEGLST